MTDESRSSKGETTGCVISSLRGRKGEEEELMPIFAIRAE
jgi:hypothetical protein